MEREGFTLRACGFLRALALVGWLLGVPATAQEPSPPPTEAAPGGDAAKPEPEAPQMTEGIEVITVKGRALEDTLQDESLSATTFGAEDIKALRIQNISDLADYTANLEINTAFAASNPTLFIRGIGLKDYNANAAGAVAVYQDGININAPAIQLFQLFDVGSVQILRGPQGSVNGRNATAGAIHVNSLLPDGEFGATGSFTYGNYNNIQAEGALSLPLIDEVLSTRVAFTANFRDGTTKNQCADWDPRENGFPDTPKVSYYPDAKALIAEYKLDKAAGVLPTEKNMEGVTAVVPRYTLAHTRERKHRRLPGAKELRTDRVCIFKDPGSVITETGEANGLGKELGLEEGDFLPAQAHQLTDFQGLQHRTNNVDNWAARGILRFQPPAARLFERLDGMDWVFNFHGGQNRSDSRHLQMVGANANSCPEGAGGAPIRPCGFHAAREGGFSEPESARILRDRGVEGFEGVRPVKAIEPGVDKDGNPTLLPARGADPFRGWYDRDGNEDLDAWGVSARGHWDLGAFVVTYLGGYEWYDRFVEDEGDANPVTVFPAEFEDSAWQISEELRAEGEGERYDWRAGAFFLHETLDAINLFPDTRGFQIEQTFDQKLWSLASYASGSYQLSEELSLQAGARYNWERKYFTLGSKAFFFESGIDVPQIDEQTAKKSWTGVTGDVTLSYAPLARFASTGEAARIDDLNLYAKYGRGMKGGHFNAGLTIQGSSVEQRIEPVEPEFIHSVELGMKSRWLEDRLILNVAGFRYWYEDLQVFDIENQAGELPLQKLLNSDARVWGAEAELQARPLPGLFLQASAGWLDTEFIDFEVTKFVVRGRGGSGTQATFDYDGHPLIAAPEWNFSGIVEYELPLFGWGSLVPQYDFSYRTKQYLDPQKLKPIHQPAYWLHNARLAYRTADGRIELAGWVQNFLDEQYRVDVFDITREFNTILEVWGDPRTYGVTLSYTW